jgi:hypothetical protein
MRKDVWRKIIRKYNLSDLFIQNLQNIFDICDQYNLDHDSFLILYDIIEIVLEYSDINATSDDNEEFIAFYNELILNIKEDEYLSDFFYNFVLDYSQLSILNHNQIENELDKGFDLVRYNQNVDDIIQDDMDDGDKHCIFITEYTTDFLTLGFGSDYFLEDSDIYGKILSKIENPILFRYNLKSLDSSCHYPQYVEQKINNDNFYRVFDDEGNVLPWPNVNPCLFCTLSSEVIKKQKEKFGLDDVIAYRGFFVNILTSMGLSFNNAGYLNFILGMYQSSSEDLCENLYNLNKFYYLEDFFTGNELLKIHGIGPQIQNELLRNGFRIISDLLEREEDVIKILGQKRGLNIINEAQDKFNE